MTAADRPSVTDDARAEAVAEVAEQIERLHPAGLIHKSTVLADLAEWADRMRQGRHANGHTRATGRAEMTEDERITAWERIGQHPFFRSCYDADGTLLDAMVERLDAALPAETTTDEEWDPECVYCQGTGMATLNPDEEPGSHFCRRAESSDHTATTERLVPHDGPGHAYGDAMYCGGCLADQERRQSPPTVAGLDVHDWAKIARAKEEALEATLADHTATTEDAPRVIGDAIRQRLSWAPLHWDLNDPDDEGWPHIVASIFHALANEGLLATARTRPTEPTDAQVLAALNATHPRAAAPSLDYWGGKADEMRAALRAAWTDADQ